ncbi:uncharacterized protein [Clytia hemisphaerica]|uniref:Protein kinase domain-containing protein n=1 Tax=Clytia hemisphaerica TaxID=252671 RepID=A0A7M5X4I5_9CNID|eukprot:TCONS_00019480-protein
MALNFQYCEEKLEDVYDIKEELGRGQFAVVKRCLSKDTSEAVAAKFVKVKRTKSSRNGLDRKLIEREAGILNSLQHEKVLKLFNVFDLGAEMCLVLELLSGGELFDKISEQEYLTEVEAACYMKQVLQGIDYLHKNNIVHLDIKPENIVLKEKYGTDIKLVDFGLAQIVKPGDEIREMMGTPEFVAPEVINYDCIGLYTDMWAIGVLAYILLSGCSPFLGDDNQETYDNICRVDYHFDEEYFDTISEDAKLFVQELLIKNPKKRNTADDCLDHPWIRSMAQFRSREDSSIIQTARFKAFVARRRWQQSFQKMKAITRFSKFLKIRASAVIAEENTKDGVDGKPAETGQDEKKQGNDAESDKTEQTKSSSIDKKQPKDKEEEVEKDPIVDRYFKKEVSSSQSKTEDNEDEESDSIDKDAETDDSLYKESLNQGLQNEEERTVQETDKDTDKQDLKEEKCEDNEDLETSEQPPIPQSRNSSIHHLDVPGIVVSHDNSRRDSNTSPNMRRKYSREMPVHYTEMLRQMTLEQVVQEEKNEAGSKEKSAENDISNESDNNEPHLKQENESKKEAKNNEHITTKAMNENTTNSEAEKANGNHENTVKEIKDDSDLRNEENSNQYEHGKEAGNTENESPKQLEEEEKTEKADIFTIDLSTIKAFDIRDKKTCRISITGRQMLFEHRMKKTRSVSLDGSKRLDVGQRSQSLAEDSFSMDCSGEGVGLHQDEVFGDQVTEEVREEVPDIGKAEEGPLPDWMREQQRESIGNAEKSESQENNKTQNNKEQTENNNNVIVGDEFMKNKGWRSSENDPSENAKEKLTLNKDLKVASQPDGKVSLKQNGSPVQNHGNSKHNKDKVALPDIIPESKIDKPDGKELEADTKNTGQSVDENENISEQQKNEKTTTEKQNLLIEEKIRKQRKGCGRCSIM